MQNTLTSTRLRALHGALLEVLGVMIRPQRDEALIREAGIKLDRALFPLIVLIERLGPIGVVELADRVGRDYTTVSRQVAKLDALGLVVRRAAASDRRVREARVTAEGQAMTDRIDVARERLLRGLFASWADADVEDLARLLSRFADALKGPSAGER